MGHFKQLAKLAATNITENAASTQYKANCQNSCHVLVSRSS